MAISFVDGSTEIRDPTTAANNFRGKYTSKLTITGALTPGSQGAVFDASNNASISKTIIPYSATAGTWLVRLRANATPVNSRVIGNGGAGGQTDLFLGNATTIGMYNAAVALQKTIASVLSLTTLGSTWDAAGRSVTGQGLAVATDANTEPSPTSIGFGVAEGGGTALSANVLWIVYLPRRMTDAELQQRTG